MAPVLRDAIVSLFRNRPALAAEVLARVWRLRVPRGPARVLDGDIAHVMPLAPGADLVVACGEGADAAAVIVEVSLAADEGKRFAWPLYQAVVRARLRVPVCLLVVAPDSEVARWAGTTVVTGQPGAPFAPVVLGPAAMPWLTPSEAALAPDLAVLSLLVHGDDEDAPDVARAAIVSAAAVDPARAERYREVVAARLGPLRRARLDALLAAKGSRSGPASGRPLVRVSC